MAWVALRGTIGGVARVMGHLSGGACCEFVRRLVAAGRSDSCCRLGFAPG
jgi:hypothetical protein